MLIWIAPIILSYAVFVYFAEHIYPFKKFREVTARRRIQSGRRAGLIALPVFFVLVFGAQFVSKYIDDGKNNEDFVATLLPETGDEPNDEINLADKTSDVKDAGEAATNKTENAASNKTENAASNKTENAASNKTENAEASETAEKAADKAAVKTVENADTPVVVKTAFASSSAAPVADAAKWISTQNPRAFTIQLNASREKASVEFFLKQSALPEPNVIFPFERNGTTWYALVHGAYSSFAGANAAMKDLPNDVQFHTPWVRGFEDLQAILTGPL